MGVGGEEVLGVVRGHCESLSLRSRKGMVLGRLLGRKGGGYNSRLNVPGVLYPP